MTVADSTPVRVNLPLRVRAYLVRKIVMDRLLFAARWLAIGIAVSLAWLLLAALLDRVCGLGLIARSCLLGTDVLFIALVLLTIFWRIVQPLDFHHAAASVEPAFDQQLETLVSHWIRPSSLASSTILRRLSEQIQTDLPTHPASSFIPWRKLFVPWATALVTVFIAILLWRVPALGLPQLFARTLHPAAGIAAVTTTHLEVFPGNAKIIEQSAVTIRAGGQRLGKGPPVIHFSTDSSAFTKAVMAPGNGAFVFNLPALQKDFRYYITAGDAQTPIYRITVLYPPAISEMHVRYEYPAYTHHQALTVTTRTGPIEAPQGTQIGLDVISLTPLAQATLQIGSQTLEGSAGASANIRHFQFSLDHDAAASLNLLGANGVSARGETQIILNAIPDQPPLAQLLEPSADIHLTPRDLLTISWLALDDFGVEKLQLQWQINNDPAHQVPLPLSGDARRCAGAVDVDLANMPLKIGDSLAITLLADDGAGHETRTATRHIAISPRSVDIDTYLRLSALHEASELSTIVQNDMRLCIAAQPEINQLNENLAAAAEAVALLKQAILQAIQHTRYTQMVVALSNLADRTAMIGSAIEQSQTASQTSDTLKQATDLAQKIQSDLAAISQGEQAEIALADRANAREIAGTTQTDPQLRARLQQTIARANAEAEQGIAGLGISLQAPDVEQQLEQRMHQGDQAVDALKSVDLLAASRDWAVQMNDPQHAPRQLAARLETAAGLEAARIDGQQVWARDLLLAGRAAHHIEETALHDPIVSHAVLKKMIGDFPEALQTLESERTGNASPGLAAARAQMKLWAAEPDLFASPADVLDRPVAQDLAMEANARMAQHDYAGAAALDAQLADTPEGRQARQNIIAAAHQMHTAERVDQMKSQQQALTAQTSEVSAPVPALARNQAQLANSIEQVRQSDDAQGLTSNTRDQAMAAVLRAQQQLAAMPATLNSQHDQTNAATQIASDLDRFAPETTSTVNLIRQNLIPSLHQLTSSTQPAETKTAADNVRSSIAQVQSALAKTQEQFTQQDPLVAAKWYAQAAAAELSRQPPDLNAAHLQQTNLFRALHSAWVAAVHQSSVDRLAGSQTLAPALSSPVTQAMPTIQTPTPLDVAGTEPTEYSEALRMYFQRLNENRDKP
ncbi:MAG TPA: hypothetical protein VGG19_17020 [Tepidisphaeraceae bacterium]|jgi:hypothetical protein